MFAAIALFILIIKGGDWFVDAASWTARVTGIPSFLIGATIVSFATTLPELLVSTMAVRAGSVELGIGNAVGSISCNIGIILGISLTVLPSVIPRLYLLEKGGMMALAGILLFFFSRNGNLSVYEGLVLLCVLALSVTLNIISLRKKDLSEAETERPRPVRREIMLNIAKFLFGAAGIVVGARLLVDKGSELARIAGVPESVIGLTIVAMGTSLPEFITTLTALIKKESGLSVGNIFGANLIDMTLILSVCAFFSADGLPVSRFTYLLDLPVMLALIALTVLPPLITGRFRRWQGLAVLIGYMGYLFAIIS